MSVLARKHPGPAALICWMASEIVAYDTTMFWGDAIINRGTPGVPKISDVPT